MVKKKEEVVIVVVTAEALLPIAVQSICPNKFGMYSDMAARFFSFVLFIFRKLYAI